MNVSQSRLLIGRVQLVRAHLDLHRILARYPSAPLAISCDPSFDSARSVLDMFRHTHPWTETGAGYDDSMKKQMPNVEEPSRQDRHSKTGDTGIPLARIQEQSTSLYRTSADDGIWPRRHRKCRTEQRHDATVHCFPTLHAHCDRLSL